MSCESARLAQVSTPGGGNPIIACGIGKKRTWISQKLTSWIY